MKYEYPLHVRKWETISMVATFLDRLHIQRSTLDGEKKETSDANGHRKNTMKNDFQQSTNFKLLSQTQGPSQNNCNLFLSL
jgi:hypothetical protein